MSLGSDLEQGSDTIGDRLGGAGRVEPPEDRAIKAGPCPVQCLGMVNNEFFFLSPSGQLRCIRDASLKDMAVLRGLFEAEIIWLWKRWPKFAKDDTAQTNAIGWNSAACNEWLVAECARASRKYGLFAAENRVRGQGVWKAAGDQVIVHAGDHLWSGGQWKRAGIQFDSMIYPTRPPDPRPDFKKPASAIDAQRLLTLLDKWRWRDPASPRLILGWLGAAMVCGMLPWLPHIWLTGDMGDGKTLLMKLIRFAVGALERASDPSEASIRALLGDTYRPCLLDEVEPGNWRAENILNVMRMASSDDQAPVTRSDANQKIHRQPIRTIFICSSILHPSPKPQDLSRITFTKLVEQKITADMAAAVEAEVDAFEALGPRLRARMILGWGRLKDNRRVWRSVLSTKDFAIRNVDQLATLLSCADTLLYDDVTDASVASDLADDLGFDAPEEIERDHDQALNTLMGQMVKDVWQGGKRPSVAELIYLSMQRGGYAEREQLTKLGLSPYPRDAGDKWTELRIANRHPQLAEWFAGTRWADGVWSQSFERIAGEGFVYQVGPTSFAGVKSRAVAITRPVFLDLFRDMDPLDDEQKPVGDLS